MAEIIRYVDTGSAGGNGTTAELSGANAAYASLFAWEAAEDTTLAGSGNWMHVYCAATGGVADTLSVTIAGWTTSATEYILIEAASAHRATADKWDTTKYRLETVNEVALSIQEDYVTVDGLQIGKSDASEEVITILSQVATNNLVTISNCRIKQAGNVNYNERGISVGDTDAIVKIWNCIIYGRGAYNDTANCGIYLSCATASVYNCTISGNANKGAAINAAAGTITVKNCAVFNNADDFVGTITIDYCASDDGDGTNAEDFTAEATDWGKVWTDYTNGDFTLKNYSSSPCCINQGTDGSAIVTTSKDIDGNDRGATWDIGAYEYISSGESTVPQIMMYYIRMRCN
jgi:hypothetical protein